MTTTDQDTTNCRVCGNPLDHTPKLGEWIMHPACQEAMQTYYREGEKAATVREPELWVETARKAVAARLKAALEAMVEAYVGPATWQEQKKHDANALGVRTLAELYPDEWHNRIPAERRDDGRG